MLVITRRGGEAVWLEPPKAEAIRVVLLRVRGNRVQIGLQLPADVSVRRIDVDGREPGSPNDKGEPMEGEEP